MSGGRSPIFLWLYSRYDEMLPILSERPYWDGFVDSLKVQFPELMNGKGNALTGERVRKAWLDVRRAKMIEQKGPSVPAQDPLPPSSVASSPQPLPVEQKPIRLNPDPDDEGFALDFAKGRK